MNPDEILRQLKPLADPDYAASIDHLAPQSPTEEGGAWTSVGVRVPILRQFVKPLCRQLKSVDDYQMMLEFTDEAFNRRIRELVFIGFAGLSSIRKHWNHVILDHVRDWVPQLSGWETTDSLSWKLLGEMVQQGVLSIDDLLEYRNYRSIWGQRVLIVSTIPSLYRGTGDTERYFEILSWYVDSREKMIYKAVSWALRDAANSHPDRVEAFLAKYKDRLHSLVLREVRNKLDTGKKNPKKS